MVEPITRNADMLVLIYSYKSIRIIKGTSMSPNGFDGKEACAIARYAGISNKVSSFGIYELNNRCRSRSNVNCANDLVFY